MKIYVDGEMPKSCLDCLCNSEYYYCNLLHETIDLDNVYSVSKNCPLQSLAEHDKEVRKQVVKEIKTKVKELIDNKDFGLCNHEYANGFCYGLQYDLAKVLDQVERSEKDETNS